MESASGSNDYYPLIRLSKAQVFHNTDPAVYIQRPTMLAAYFKTDMDEISDDVRFKYFREPSAKSYPLDLHAGFELFRERRPQQAFERFIQIPKYLLKCEDDVLKLNAPKTTVAGTMNNGNANTPPSRSTTILTQRRLLARIMYLPYVWSHPLSDLQFYATKYCGILCLLLIDDARRAPKEKKEFHHNKFSQYCFSDCPDEEPNTEVPVNENEFYFGIYRTSLKNFDIIYSGEFSGIISDHKVENVHDQDELNELRFVLTKTMLRHNTKGITYLKRLLSRWWLQAYLSNVNDIYIGKKEDNGIINCPVDHKSAPDLVKGVDLQPLICNKFLHKFLTIVDRRMSNVDCPYTVFEFKYDSRLQEIGYKIERGKSELSFLSEEFIEYLKKMKKK